eukprot:847008-Amphidinium_carterae.1
MQKRLSALFFELSTYDVKHFGCVLMQGGCTIVFGLSELDMKNKMQKLSGFGFACRLIPHVRFCHSSAALN